MPFRYLHRSVHSKTESINKPSSMYFSIICHLQCLWYLFQKPMSQLAVNDNTCRRDSECCMRKPHSSHFTGKKSSEAPEFCTLQPLMKRRTGTIQSHLCFHKIHTLVQCRSIREGAILLKKEYVSTTRDGINALELR